MRRGGSAASCRPIWSCSICRCPARPRSHLREHRPATRVLVLTAHDDDAYVRGLLAAGVAGYMLKDEASETLFHAIRGVVRGGTWFSQAIAAKLARAIVDGVDGRPVFTDREEVLLRELEQGWDNAQIAAALHLSEQTVRNYLSRLYAKLAVRSRAEAIVWLRDHPAPERGLATGRVHVYRPGRYIRPGQPGIGVPTDRWDTLAEW